MRTIRNANNTADRKLVLVVEDEFINREVLVNIVSMDYEVLAAETGGEALSYMEEYRDRLSMILLDLNLPDISGIDILGTVNERDEAERIPVIVLTSEKDEEVKVLNLGAADFIPKPYPTNPEIILARIRRTIELYENRVIISQTEHDPLTGLYNREFFYLYAEQFDRRNMDVMTDAIVFNVDHFHMINERYGRAYADGVLKRIADRIERLTEDGRGIACRRDADNFLIYCRHRDDHEAMFETVSSDLSGGEGAGNVVRLRMGVYPETDKGIDIETRFDRAKQAADTAKNRINMPVAVYDSELSRTNMFNEQLLVTFEEAIKEEQFKVYFQPKFRILGEKPVLSSAEALVRWDHPEFGFMSPGRFIGAFENNGLISRLDNYVWEMTAKQIHTWSDRLGVTIPVSVNVSRADLFDPAVYDTILDIVERNGIERKDLILEITESAYAEDSGDIIKKVEDLRVAGFMVEMDDFGSGYSSLNMLATLPIDALKLDMQFIRSAFREGGDTGLISIMIEIAKHLGVPVIAEGVETEEQMLALMEMGCDIVQGYYFSKPVPPEEFEKFLLQ